MRIFNIDEAIQNFDAVLELAQKEPVVIANEGKMLGALIPMEEYRRLEQYRRKDAES